MTFNRQISLYLPIKLALNQFNKHIILKKLSHNHLLLQLQEKLSSLFLFLV